MDQPTSGWARRYQAALSNHLTKRSAATLPSALVLGRRALALELSPLALARIHEAALVKIGGAAVGRAAGARSAEFFNEALSPIVATHRAARLGRVQRSRLTVALGRRTAELAAMHAQLKRGVLRRKRIEEALGRSRRHYAVLLGDSERLQEGLRQLAHRALSMQDAERRTISRELQNEVNQTLLGISIRLAALRQEVQNNNRDLRKEIATTELQVQRSADQVFKVARKFQKA